MICETDQQREELTHCYNATLGGDPSSPILQLATLISAVAVAGRKNNGNGELAAHLADLKKSEALMASHAPEIRKYLEQLNSAQGDINRLRTLSASPASGDTLGKRLAWRAGIGLGLVDHGSLRLSASSHYADSSLNSAVRDDELALNWWARPDNVQITLPDGTVSKPGPVRDWVFCPAGPIF